MNQFREFNPYSLDNTLMYKQDWDSMGSYENRSLGFSPRGIFGGEQCMMNGYGDSPSMFMMQSPSGYAPRRQGGGNGLLLLAGGFLLGNILNNVIGNAGGLKPFLNNIGQSLRALFQRKDGEKHVKHEKSEKHLDVAKAEHKNIKKAERAQRREQHRKNVLSDGIYESDSHKKAEVKEKNHDKKSNHLSLKKALKAFNNQKASEKTKVEKKETQANPKTEKQAPATSETQVNPKNESQAPVVKTPVSQTPATSESSPKVQDKVQQQAQETVSKYTTDYQAITSAALSSGDIDAAFEQSKAGSKSVTPNQEAKTDYATIDDLFKTYSEDGKVSADNVNQMHADFKAKGLKEITIAGEKYNIIYGEDAVVNIKGTEGNDIIFGANEKTYNQSTGNDLYLSGSGLIKTIRTNLDMFGKL